MIIDPTESTVEISKSPFASSGVENRTASDLSGFNASPFTENHRCRAVTQFFSCKVSLADDILDIAIYNFVSSAY